MRSSCGWSRCCSRYSCKLLFVTAWLLETARHGRCCAAFSRCTVVPIGPVVPPPFRGITTAPTTTAERHLTWQRTKLSRETCSRNRASSSSSSSLPLSSSDMSSVETTGTSVVVDVDDGDILHINTTLTLPISIADLLSLPAGDCVTSETIRLQRAGEAYEFSVELYPRGCSSSINTWSSSRAKPGKGFGMAVASVQPSWLSSSPTETVDIFVKFQPSTTDQWVDASFAVSLLGRQTKPQRRFDVEWRSGMRFVDAVHCQLSQGRAPDFGARLMQTRLLPRFLGCADDSSSSSSTTNGINDDPHEVDALPQSVQIQCAMQLHTDRSLHDERNDDFQSTPRPLFSFRDARSRQDSVDDSNSTLDLSPSMERHDTEQVRVGRIVVPVLTRIAQRPRMFEQGAYPGVEYRIMRIHTMSGTTDTDPNLSTDVFYSRPGAFYDLKPIYPLVAQLERTWPVTVCEADIPKLVTPTQYNVISALGSLATAVTGLLLAFTLSQAVSLYYIPSRSMDPTLSVGDVLLVEKMSPRWQNFWRQMNVNNVGGAYRVNDIVLFTPPERLLDVIAQSGGRVQSSRDLFVKRIAAGQGDVVTVDRTLGTVTVNGDDVSTNRRDLCDAEPLGLIRRYLSQGVTQSGAVVPPNTVEVLGDCGSVSIDSRVWGPLPLENIVGRPIVRLWPLSKFGAVPSLPPLTMNWKATEDL